MSERLNDYFAKEAGEYLDQLERLLDLPGVPDADSLLRLATGVRGSAQMAQAETVAGVAERLEDAARAVLTSNIAWSEELRSLASRTVTDLKLLVRALNRWGPDEEERVQIAMARWDANDPDAVPVLAPRSEANVVPIATLFYDDEGPHTFPAEGGAVSSRSTADRVVPIQDLLFRGEAALLEAIALRPTFESFARGDAVPDRTLGDLVQELFDLVELGITTERSDG